MVLLELLIGLPHMDIVQPLYEDEHFWKVGPRPAPFRACTCCACIVGACLALLCSCFWFFLWCLCLLRVSYPLLPWFQTVPQLVDARAGGWPAKVAKSLTAVAVRCCKFQSAQRATVRDVLPQLTALAKQYQHH